MRMIRPLLFAFVGAAVGAVAMWSISSRSLPNAGTPDAANQPAMESPMDAQAEAPVESAMGEEEQDGPGPSPAEGPGLFDSAEAEVRPLRRSELDFAVPGVVAERLVRLGDDVTAGDPLLRLDDAGERARLREAEAALSTAEAQVRVARATEATAREQVVAAEASVRAAEAARDGADAALRMTATQAEATIAQAEAERRQADASVAQAQAGVAEARAAVEQAVAQVTQAESQREQAEAARASAALAVEQRTLRAPFDGRVLGLRPEVGESVPSGGDGRDGAGAVTLADLSRWRVATTNLTESQVVHVAVGDRVTIEVDALPERSFEGVVEQVGYLAQLVRGDVTYSVVARIVDDAASRGHDALRPGMTAVVRGLLR